MIHVFSDNPNTRVDIVFVHGLTGDNVTTWTSTSGTCWPGELLPVDCPTARILSYNYQPSFGDFYPTESREAIDPHSIALLDRLANLREETKTEDRPIIYVAHGLGGLVCANALSQQLGMNEARKRVVNSTCGLIFLGTPFVKAAEGAEIGSHYFALVNPKQGEAPKDLAARLWKIADIIKAFMVFLRHRDLSATPIEVACFFEELPTAAPGLLVVPEKAATLPGYELYGINGDHLSMCQFDSGGDAGYRIVTAILMRWIQLLDVSKATKSDMHISAVNYGNVVNGHVFGGNIYGESVFLGNTNISSPSSGKKSRNIFGNMNFWGHGSKEES